MNKIPKKIHYCWFGGNPLPEETKRYIESWKKYCPDYEIIEWNENNFDININDYVREAYQAKKWAFVADYARLYAMYHYGGIYMDTDIEVLKTLNPFLENHAFSGFESSGLIQTGIMGAEPKFKLLKEFLNYYDDKHFINDDGSFDTTTNVVIMTNILKKYNLKLNNEKQEIEGWLLYPADYFCPKDFKTGVINITRNTVVIHHFNCSWFNELEKEKSEIYRKLINKYGEKKGKIIAKIMWYCKHPQLILKKVFLIK